MDKVMIEKLKLLLTPATPFKEIAEMLFQNFHIEKGEVRYDFLEIEYYSSLIDKNENITYKRICEAGNWFPHYSGVDIAFKSDEKQYGGILIRSLLKTQNNQTEFIAGPLRCSCELFKDLLNINGNSSPLQLVENAPQKQNIEYTIRQGIASDKDWNQNKKEEDKKKYCAYIKHDINSGWKNGKDHYNAKPWKREKQFVSLNN